MKSDFFEFCEVSFEPKSENHKSSISQSTETLRSQQGGKWIKTGENIYTKIYENEDETDEISKMEKKTQREIFGLSDKNLKNVLNRSYSTPILFKGNGEQKKDLFKTVKTIGLSLHEGGRVINICDNVSKVKAMNRVIKMIKKIKNEIKTIGVGDNYNDLDMLRNSNIACLVFNDQFLMEPININNCLVSKQSAPLGWEEVVKMALEKIK